MSHATYAVTGVTSGIGAELASILKDRGHRVIGFDIIETEANVDRFVPLDLNDPDSIAQACSIDESFDGLCNNAGLPPRPGLEQKILQVNYLGQRQFTHALLAKMNNGSAIVNMASRAGHGWRESIDQVQRLTKLNSADKLPQFIRDENIDPTRAYNLSKEAMILWTSAETEPMIARNIRINSLSPGAVSTGILDDFVTAFGEKVARNIKRAGRAAQPTEVAEIAAFMLSQASSWIKGIDIPIDGGMGSIALTDALDLKELQLAG